jgi:pseudouridylate synthase
VSESFAMSEAVRSALDASRPVVALETSVLAHGLPHPRNVEAAERMSRAIREWGAEPAWVWIGGGAVHIGLGEEDRHRLIGAPPAVKVARRDVVPVVASGRLGATTVSATVWAADRTGIEVVATGGIGGVHLRADGSRLPGSDVSADLLELARVPRTVVCSGPKSIVDPVATAERLEELGVATVGYRCDRLPHFLVRETGLPLDHRADTPGEVAAMVAARRRLGVVSSLLVCNPIPAEDALSRVDVERALGRCLLRARTEGVTGRDLTPFLLSSLAEDTEGASLEANLSLLESNAALAGEIAATLAEGSRPA